MRSQPKMLLAGAFLVGLWRREILSSSSEDPMKKRSTSLELSKFSSGLGTLDISSYCSFLGAIFSFVSRSVGTGVTSPSEAQALKNCG